jgi:hypothetical protein
VLTESASKMANGLGLLIRIVSVSGMAQAIAEFPQVTLPRETGQLPRDSGPCRRMMVQQNGDLQGLGAAAKRKR